MRWTTFALLGAGCLDPGTVELQGVLVEGWEAGAQPVAGATVRALDEVGAEVDRTLTRDSGWYRLEALAGGRVFVEVEGDGLVTSAFAGVSGLDPRLRVPNGEIFAVDEATWAAEAATWEGCPGLGEGGVVFGRVELLDFEGGGGGPIQIETATLSLVTSSGDELPACYLDDTGSYDPGLSETGPLSRFLVAGVPGGRHSLELEWTPFEGFDEAASYDVWVPEAGLAPRFPLYVTFDPER